MMKRVLVRSGLNSALTFMFFAFSLSLFLLLYFCEFPRYLMLQQFYCEFNPNQTYNPRLIVNIGYSTSLDLYVIFVV